MVRFTLCLTLLATPLAAQDTTQLCKVSAEIAGAAVAERSSGHKPEVAVKTISDDLSADKAAYEGAVQPIVEWVYTLPSDQLTAEVAVAYETACLAQ
jgi:hypothetical protein